MPAGLAGRHSLPVDTLCDLLGPEREHTRNSRVTGLAKYGSLRPAADFGCTHPEATFDLLRWSGGSFASSYSDLIGDFPKAAIELTKHDVFYWVEPRMSFTATN
ncbi:hypothetical protein IB267_17005 [Ensifer sp. ENS09]|uniref:hypothetical protein n=1 Tax=Ensifer sp. ENS09 TaxID=2769263 RepID=UPI0017804EBA|nr:hypothetical protein [Ensifer sp. ENS09]MBD9650057.1 hypothetical protein [Ensifer sp. ENS09]